MVDMGRGSSGVGGGVIDPILTCPVDIGIMAATQLHCRADARPAIGARLVPNRSFALFTCAMKGVAAVALCFGMAAPFRSQQ